MKALVLIAAVTSALALASSAFGGVVDQAGAEGNTPEFALSVGPIQTTAFNVGTYTFSPAPVTVKWATDCLYPVNDRAGAVVLSSGESATVFTASRQVGTPWLGWDRCSFQAFYAVDFGPNQDGSLVHSAVTGWLSAHN